VSDNLTTHLNHLVRERHPQTSPAALQDTAAYLRQQFTRQGLAVAAHRFEAWGNSYDNLIATKRAANGQTVAPLILAAHYDTVEGSPGADDNASGLVVLIEVARRLAQTDLARPVQLIAFCLE